VHGHCIYTQNKDGTKLISNCFMSVAKDYGCYTMHAYGSKKAFVQNYVIEENIVAPDGGSKNGPFLVGGGVTDFNILVRKNLLYGSRGIAIGPYTTTNKDCTVSDNVVIDGDIEISKYETADVSGNKIIGGKLVTTDVKELKDKDNAQNAPAPSAPVAYLYPNKYESDRANLAIYNPTKQSSVKADVSALAKKGAYWLLDPKDVFSKPLYSGKINAGAIEVPTSDPFRAFVLIVSE
jgi:hypothetical protein